MSQGLRVIQKDSQNCTGRPEPNSDRRACGKWVIPFSLGRMLVSFRIVHCSGNLHFSSIFISVQIFKNCILLSWLFKMSCLLLDSVH